MGATQSSCEIDAIERIEAKCPGSVQRYLMKQAERAAKEALAQRMLAQQEEKEPEGEEEEEEEAPVVVLLRDPQRGAIIGLYHTRTGRIQQAEIPVPAPVRIEEMPSAAIMTEDQIEAVRHAPVVKRAALRRAINNAQICRQRNMLFEPSTGACVERNLLPKMHQPRPGCPEGAMQTPSGMFRIVANPRNARHSEIQQRAAAVLQQALSRHHSFD